MSDERPEIDLAEYLKQRQQNGKSLIVIYPMDDSDLLNKTGDIKSAISSSDNTM